MEPIAKLMLIWNGYFGFGITFIVSSLIMSLTLWENFSCPFVHLNGTLSLKISWNGFESTCKALVNVLWKPELLNLRIRSLLFSGFFKFFKSWSSLVTRWIPLLRNKVSQEKSFCQEVFSFVWFGIQSRWSQAWRMRLQFLPYIFFCLYIVLPGSRHQCIWEHVSWQSAKRNGSSWLYWRSLGVRRGRRILVWTSFTLHQQQK